MLRDLFSLFPACAGVIPDDGGKNEDASTFPRMCGGDPYPVASEVFLRNFSPHVRG